MKEKDGKELGVVTVTGIDHPGIIAALTSKIADFGINIEDLSQTVVSGLFTMILVVDITGKDLSAFQKALEDVGKDQKVEIRVQHEKIFRFMHRV